MSNFTIQEDIGFANIEILNNKDLHQNNITYIKWNNNADINLNILIKLQHYNELIKATSELLQKQRFLKKSLDEYNEKE